jgi:hypothetical protein
MRNTKTNQASLTVARMDVAAAAHSETVESLCIQHPLRKNRCEPVAACNRKHANLQLSAANRHYLQLKYVPGYLQCRKQSLYLFCRQIFKNRLAQQKEEPLPLPQKNADFFSKIGHFESSSKGKYGIFEGQVFVHKRTFLEPTKIQIINLN